MMSLPRLTTCLAAFAFGLAACGDRASESLEATTGPNPVLKAPHKSLLPELNIAPAVGWTGNATPIAAQGLAVNAFAKGLDHPRWLLSLPNGDVLVAETNAPPKPDDGKGIRGWVQKQVMKRAGSVTTSANRITLLRDGKGAGTADTKTVFIEGLNSPYGLALAGDTLYVADTDAILKFPYHEGDTKITAAGIKVVDLPGGSINHHWTKNIIASPDGSKLYVTVGSNSNAGENGIAAEGGRAAIWEVDAKSGDHRIFASGLRNPNGMGWNPASGALWVAVNERDELGSDLVPDYMTSVKDGAFYGWPYSYYGQHVDDRVKPQEPDMVAKAIPPDYALGAHTASLGFSFSTGDKLPAPFNEGAFIGQHGSWNRDPASGYKVVFVPFSGSAPSGKMVDVLTGFLNQKGEAQGRPVGVAIDKAGDLLVVDDVGNTVWRVTAAAQQAAAVTGRR
jgi:glucose/arabinose dehydrogenase